MFRSVIRLYGLFWPKLFMHLFKMFLFLQRSLLGLGDLHSPSLV